MPSPHDWKNDIPSHIESETISPEHKTGFRFTTLNTVIALFIFASGGYVGFHAGRFEQVHFENEYAKASAFLPSNIYERLVESKKSCINGPETGRSCMALWQDVVEVRRPELTSR